MLWGASQKGGYLTQQLMVSQSPAADLQFDVSVQITCSKARRRPF